jgi:hypothetical protein
VTPGRREGEQLLEHVAQLLTAAELENVHVSIDPRRAPQGAKHGLVTLGAPDLAWQTFGDAEAKWQLIVAAGPADNYLAAWDTLTGILDALASAGLNLIEAEAIEYLIHNNAAPVPAYRVELGPIDL